MKDLSINHDTHEEINQNLHKWLKNGIAALAIAGLFSIILVLLRTPQINKLFTDKSVFQSALVIHVNLSVLVWMLSMTAMIWSLNKIRSGFESVYAILAITGMIMMALSPLYKETIPVMNNYVPMLQNIFFIIGLSLFGTGMLIFAVQTVVTSFFQLYPGYGGRIISIMNFTSSLMFIMVWVCFALSYFDLDALTDIVPLDLDFYYEMLYWSGGHLLQFIYTQLLMVVLLILTESWQGGKVRFSSVYETLLALNCFLGLTIFTGHFSFNLADGEFKEFFTLHMIYVGGIAPTIFIALLFFELISNRVKRLRFPQVPIFIPASFLSSALLFLSGGLIGVVISGINVTIPAHYHGSIVGISIALMGLSYLLCFGKEIQNIITTDSSVIALILKNINLKNMLHNADRSKDIKKSAWQIVMITFGQLLHISGLALAGGYGVMRKTPGEEIALSAKIYMGMVGGGGLIAIIGGLIFVYICVKNLRPFYIP